MKKGLLPPLAATVAIIGLVYAGKQAGTYNENLSMHCAYNVATHDAPAADILFVGNSQTGAAINVPLLEGIMQNSAGRRLRIEKLALEGANITPTRMMVEDYLRHRGAPKLVVYQPVAVRRVVDKQAGLPVHPTVNLAFQEFAELVSLRADAPPVPDHGWLPHWMRKGYRTTPALWLDQQGGRITAALSAPRLGGYVADCRSEKKFRIAGIWPFAGSPAKHDRFHPERGAPETERWRVQMRNRMALDWSAPDRLFELDQNRKTMAALEAAGSEILLAYYPNFGGAPEDAVQAHAAAQVFGYEAIDVRAALPERARDELESHFYDPFHLDFAGADMVTQSMAARLEDRVE